mmetsp:Transcript_2749/g.6986  ORF Transcript_2749/g.6986 Transcript_2749/m.6986 type:complete len:171 (+) Transcript_2749:131-643(+)
MFPQHGKKRKDAVAREHVRDTAQNKNEDSKGTKQVPCTPDESQIEHALSRVMAQVSSTPVSASGRALSQRLSRPTRLSKHRRISQVLPSAAQRSTFEGGGAPATSSQNPALAAATTFEDIVENQRTSAMRVPAKDRWRSPENTMMHRRHIKTTTRTMNHLSALATRALSI